MIQGDAHKADGLRLIHLVLASSICVTQARAPALSGSARVKV
jgi:hypothetical protein